MSENTIKLICTIPPGETVGLTDVREIYIYAKDQGSTEFLLAIGQPDVDLKYDPSGALSMRLQLRITNINIAGLYQFNYSQANEIDDHNKDPNAHLVVGAQPNDHCSRGGDQYRFDNGSTVPVNASLNEVYDRTLFRDLFKVSTNVSLPTLINLGPSYLDMADFSQVRLSTGALLSTYAGGTVDFATGTVVGGGSSFTPIDFSGQASKWAKYSVNLLADNTVLVLPASGFGTTKDNAPNPVLSGIASRVVAVQDDGDAGVGTIENITEANLIRIPTGSGAAASTGGAGGGLLWNDDAAMSPERVTEFGQDVFKFTDADAGTQKLNTVIKVPDDYLGAQIGLYINKYSPGAGSNSILLQSTAYLVRDGIDGMDTTANSHASGNSAVTIAAPNRVHSSFLPLTDVNGKINGVDVSPGDIIKIELERGTDSDSEDIRLLPSLVSLKTSL